MVRKNSELKALFQLMDDPDEEIYKSVEEKLFSFGSEIIPELENYWISIEDATVQDRIDELIHRLQFKEIEAALLDWKKDPVDLLEATLIISKFQYPGIDENEIKASFEKLRKAIWLELNNYLTPLEQINVFNAILFHVAKFRGIEISYSNADHFLFNKVLEAKTGNTIGIGFVYLLLAQMLDIPLKAVNIPRQFVLAYFDEQFHLFNPAGEAKDAIKFYVYPLNGQFFSQRDVEEYLRKLEKKVSANTFKPRQNVEVIKFILEELEKCYQQQENIQKQASARILINLLNED